MRSTKNKIITTSYKLFKSRISGKESIFFSFVGYFLDSIIILFIGLTFGIIIKSGLLSFHFVFQSWLLMLFLFRLFYYTARPFNIVPFLTLPISSTIISDFFLQKELYCGWVFMTYPFVLPILILNDLFPLSILQCCYLTVNIYLAGLTINLFSNHIRIIIDQRRTTFSIAIGLIILVYIWFSLKHDYLVIPLQDFFLNRPFLIMLLLSIICIILWILTRISFKKSTYRIYENHLYKTDYLVINNSLAIIKKNYWIPLHIKEMIRCRGLKRHVRNMLSLIFLGIFSYIAFDFDLLGFWLILGSYPFVMIEYSILRDSSYFDAIQTKPIGIRHLLISDYFLSILFCTLCFIPTLGLVYLLDSSNILPLMTIYFFTIGPSALMLFQIAVYSNKRFDPFETIQGNNRSGMSDLQRLLRIIAGLFSFFPIISNSFFPGYVNYILIIISIFCIIIHPLWLQNVCNRFERRKYEAMEQFRFQ